MMLKLLLGWQKSMEDELNFHQESANLIEVTSLTTTIIKLVIVIIIVILTTIITTLFIL